MSQQALVTAADISRLAGVTRATVSNWRRRHPDFPAPVGGTDTSPAYDLDAVRAWLSARGQLPSGSPAGELRIMLRAQLNVGSAAPLLFAVVLAAARSSREDLANLTEVPDDQISSWFRSATGALASEVPGVAEAVSDDLEAPLLRALVRQVFAEGAEATADILSERLLEDSNVAGTYLTPGPLSELMVGLLANEAGASPARVLDPACGSGSLLAAAARVGATEIFGQDVLTGQAAQTAVRLRLSAPTADIEVRAGDSLRSDAFSDQTVDAVLCNPPYADRQWGHDELAYDQRWAYGVPPKGESELAWVQHCLAHLTPGSRAVLLMPPAVAERASGRRIRAQLLRGGVLRAVIALPQGAAVPLHIGLHLWVLQQPEPNADLPETILFVDTATTPNKQTPDWPEFGDAVLTAWGAHCAGEDVAAIPGVRAVNPIDLLDQAVDLTPARQVRGAHAAADPVQMAREAAALQAHLHRTAAEMGELSGWGDWRPVGEQSQGWRTATAADLMRGGAVELLRSNPSRRDRPGDPESPAGSEDGVRRVLTARDVIEGRTASATFSGPEGSGPIYPLRLGDVLLPEIFRSENPTVARVVEADDVDCLLGPHLMLFRPDPQRLDPWFLAGFLAATENVSAATTGTSVVRVDPRRLRVPLLPIVEQRRYGDAFRHLHAIRKVARLIAQATDETTRILSAGLTGGALLPPGHESA